MARKQTRAELEAELARFRAAEFLQMIALQDAVLGKLQHVGAAVRFDGWQVTAQLGRPTGAHGGFVVSTFRTQGQRPQVEAAFLDDLLDQQRRGSCQFPPALLDKLTIARQRAINEEEARKAPFVGRLGVPVTDVEIARALAKVRKQTRRTAGKE
jgi:hypothetical protein